MGKFIKCLAGRWHRDERGIALVESVVAVIILGTAITLFTTSLATGSLAIRETDQEVISQSLARTQLEYIKNYAFNPGAVTYPSISAPEGYSISVTVAPVPDTTSGIQKVTANIFREGELVFTIADYKVNR